MAPRPRCSRLLSLCLLALLLVAAARPRVHIGDDLEDVVDSEEPEAWQREATKRAPLIEEPPEDVLKEGFSKLALSVVSVDPAKAMLLKWAGWLAEAGMRGRHITFEPLGEHEEDVLVRYGDEADFSGPGLEFLMRQPEVRSCLVKGKPVTPAQYWEGREDEL